jgi:membrane-associated protease RseP (regulator of RpoE activity)
MRWLLAAAFSSVACGGAEAPIEKPRASEAPTEPVPSLKRVEPPPVEALPEARLDRASLAQVLDAGPGAFLARFEVRPAFHGNVFFGWELVRFVEPSSPLASAGIHPGDVVTEVNRHKLERPENLSKLWEALRAAETITVVGERAGEPFELSFEVAP